MIQQNIGFRFKGAVVQMCENLQCCNMATTLQNCYLQNGQNVILPKPTIAMQQYTKWWQQMIISQFQNHARKESLHDFSICNFRIIDYFMVLFCNKFICLQFSYMYMVIAVIYISINMYMSIKGGNRLPIKCFIQHIHGHVYNF